MTSINKHPVLQNLPQDLKKNPSILEIKKWLKRKIKIFNILIYIFVGISLLSLVPYFFFDDILNEERGFDIFSKITNILMSISSIMLAIFCYQQSNKFNLTDDQIKDSISDTVH